MVKNVGLDIISIDICLVAMSPIGDATTKSCFKLYAQPGYFVLSYILKCSNQQV